MGVKWELEHDDLRIEPHDGVAAWNFKNVGDETAPAGTEVCAVTIWKRPDGAPWTRSVSLPTFHIDQFGNVERFHNY